MYGTYRNLLLITVILMIIIAQSGAQEEYPPFFVKGATWYYDAYEVHFQPHPPEDPALLLRYTRDTIIDSLEAVIIEESALTLDGEIYHSIRLRWIMRQEGPKIYQLTDDGFSILYEFSVMPMDTFYINVNGSYAFETDDFDNDGHLDILTVGNFQSQVMA